MPLSRAMVRPVNPILSNIAIEYRNAELISDQIFPKIPVKGDSGTYYTFTSKDRFAIANAHRRAPGANFIRGQFNVGTGNFVCEEDAEELAVDRRIQNNAIDPFDPFKSATNIVTDRILLRREFRILSAITNAVTFVGFTNVVAAGDRLNVVASDPVAYLKARAALIWAQCGKWPNRMVISMAGWMALTEHPVITDRLKNTDAKILTTDIFAQLITVNKENPMKVLVSTSLYNSAEEGQAIVMTPVFGNFCFLGYVTPTPAIDQPTVGYIFESKPFTVENYYENRNDSDIVRARCVYDLEITATDCGYLLVTIV